MASQPQPRKPTPDPIRYEIRDATGERVAVHCRQDSPAGKRMWWEQPDGTKGLGGRPPADLPLYDIQLLDDRSTVFLGEGEKTTDALRAAGRPAVGTVTGAAGTPGRAALADLNGRNVVVWPDNDDVGRQHMHKVGAGLTRIAADVRMIAWSDAPEHGDAADFLFPGKSAADLHDMAEAVAGGKEAYAPTGHTLDELAELMGAAVPITVAEEGAQTMPLLTPEPEKDEAASVGGRRNGAKGRLLTIAAEAELFSSLEGEPYADVVVGNRRETWRIGSDGFSDWLRRACWARHTEAPPEQALKEAVLTLAARARYEGPARPVCLRVGEDDGALYIDLLDEDLRAVEITPAGWAILAAPPVRFRRGSSARALPEPVRGGSLDELLPFLNIAEPAEQQLALAWLVFACMPRGAFPPFVLGGQQDAGKSTVARVLRSLIDPDDTPLTPAPRDDEDLIVVASDNWLPIFDNLSHLEPWLSDALCRLGDGTGLKRRARYTDSSVAVVHAKRPVILTGIGELATRGDLLNRALILRLPPLDDAHRRPDTELWVALEEARPRMLGALYDTLSGVLAELPKVGLPRLPRMGDFARVGVAAERVLAWPRGSFLAAYAENRATGEELALEFYPIVESLCRLAQERGDWEGSISELLQELEQRAPEEARRSRRWPGAAHILSGQLDRLAPSLQQRHVTVKHGRSRQGSWASIRDDSNGMPESYVGSVTSVTSVTEASPGGAPVGPVTVGDAGDASRVKGASHDLNAALSVAGAHTPSPNGLRDPRDAGDASLPLNPQEEREEKREGNGGSDDQPTAYVRAALASGRLDGLPLTLAPGVTAEDAAKTARVLLAELGRPGQVGVTARDHVHRLADALRAAEGAS